MDITRTGKTLSARVSAELLESIFHPKSPLHDGAVVVRENTLVAAACVLPYSERPGLSASAGMRHRAALGISEQTDAVCVVVSEETGAISLAVDGALSRRLDRAHLTERLMGLFETEKSISKFLFWKRDKE
jgi:diadenylate cyclase